MSEEFRKIIEHIYNTHPRSIPALITAIEKEADAYASRKVREERERWICSPDCDRRLRDAHFLQENAQREARAGFMRESELMAEIRRLGGKYPSPVEGKEKP